jgi:response regulator RpfG family c-di-GMP phosphodiesterase
MFREVTRMRGSSARLTDIRVSREDTVDHSGSPLAQTLLLELQSYSVVMAEDWERLPASLQSELSSGGEDDLLAGLIAHGLLTEYQAARIDAGKAEELILGNYRILDRIGAGGMGVVFKAEHVDLRAPVAVKLLSPSHSQDPRVQQRFLAEMRAVAKLQHPNIVSAMDAGRCSGPNPDSGFQRYFVMEFVAGQDVEEYVLAKGPLSAPEACDIVYQIAFALAEAFKHGLVHRDIKPSNVRLTPEGQAKLLDFGLARHFTSRMTEPGTMLGTIDYMAPEQFRDAGAVDIRADVYGLGGVLYWCLTGQTPFPAKENIAEEVTARLTQQPPSVRAVRSSIPAELDAVVNRMMALKPGDRYATPQAVMQTLTPYLRTEMRDHLPQPVGDARDLRCERPHGAMNGPRIHKILLADDDPQIRLFCKYALQGEGYHCDEATDGQGALEALGSGLHALVFLDIDMPRLKGDEVCRRIRERPPCPHFKIIMFSGRASPDEMSLIMLAGADDFLAKPFGVVQLLARAKAALQLKDAQDHADLLNRHLLAVNQGLEQNLSARDGDLIHARNALVLGLAELVGYRDAETGAHLMRLQRYCRCLAQEAAQSPAFGGQVDMNFIEMLECCAPLHDVGKAGLPDHILLKPGKLTADELVLMQAHTTMGSDTLQKVADRHGFARAFLQMAVEITRHHHERWDGRGYPDGLEGEAIPLAARIVAVADVYDALRSRRVYKPSLSHATALRMMVEDSPGHFDPSLLHAFTRCASDFEKTFRQGS